MHYILIKIRNIGSNRYKLLMKELEDIGIKWYTGLPASSRDYDDVLLKSFSVGYSCISYRISNNNLTLSFYNSDSEYYLCNNGDEFVDSILHYRQKKPTSIPDIKLDSSRWNTKCHCGANAYDSGFSIECERKCS